MANALSLNKDKIRILLLEGIHQSAVSYLQANGYQSIEQIKGALDEEALREAIRGVHMIGIRSRTQLNATILAQADRLMAIGCFCIGTNQVDLAAARRFGIPVFNAPYSNTRSVAELVIGEIVMLLRRIPSRAAACERGEWDKSAANAWEVRGKTLGIVGYGSIGSQVSVLAEAFGMRVVFYDTVDKLPHGNATPVESLRHLLEQSDVVSLHVPQTEQTRNMMGEREFTLMKRGAILINNARGSVVDISALAGALKSGHLMGAAVDVFPKEPKNAGEKFESALQGLSNVILTPHIGGSTVEAQESIGVEVAKRFVAYSDVGSTLGAVDFPAVQLPERPRGTRFMHVHHNRPGLMRYINEIFQNESCNIVAQYLQTDGDVGYVVVETDTPSDRELNTRLLSKLRDLEGTIRARLLYERV